MPCDKEGGEGDDHTQPERDEVLCDGIILQRPYQGTWRYDEPDGLYSEKQFRRGLEVAANCPVSCKRGCSQEPNEPD